MEVALRKMAQDDDVSAGQLIRELVNREVSRRQRAKPPIRADERLIAPLRARLAHDLAESRNWQDLDEKLRQKGYVLRASGGGLALHNRADGARICKASELGFSYSRLMRRFGRPFPGHAHTWLAEKFLASEDRPPEDDVEVIERG